MTKYAVPKSGTFNLLSAVAENTTDNATPTTHWIPWLSIYCLTGDWQFDRRSVPGELLGVMRFFPGTMEYLPLMYVDRSRVTKRHLELVTRENGSMGLEVSLVGVGVGRLRLAMLFANSMQQLQGLGFGEKELDEVKGVLDNDLWLLGLIAFFHLLFDFLAFKIKRHHPTPGTDWTDFMTTYTLAI